MFEAVVLFFSLFQSKQKKSYDPVQFPLKVFFFFFNLNTNTKQVLTRNIFNRNTWKFLQVLFDVWEVTLATFTVSLKVVKILQPYQLHLEKHVWREKAQRKSTTAGFRSRVARLQCQQYKCCTTESRAISVLFLTQHIFNKLNGM